MEKQNSLYLLYADLLEYPAQKLKPHLVECAEVLSGVSPSAGNMLLGFQNWVDKETLAKVEETYTSTFDLQGICCPYVGHHLFGDNYQRSWFMARLNEGYRERGFSYKEELPDHITVILRFLACGCEDEFSQVLRDEGLFPSVGKMVRTFGEDGSRPYGQMLRSLSQWLQDEDVTGNESLSKSEMGGLANA